MGIAEIGLGLLRTARETDDGFSGTARAVRCHQPEGLPLPLLAGNRTLISRAVLSHGEVRAIELPSVYFDPFQLPKAISVQSGVEGRYAKNYR